MSYSNEEKNIQSSELIHPNRELLIQYIQKNFQDVFDDTNPTNDEARQLLQAKFPQRKLPSHVELNNKPYGELYEIFLIITRVFPYDQTYL